MVAQYMIEGVERCGNSWQWSEVVATQGPDMNTFASVGEARAAVAELLAMRSGGAGNAYRICERDADGNRGQVIEAVGDPESGGADRDYAEGRE